MRKTIIFITILVFAGALRAAHGQSTSKVRDGYDVEIKHTFSVDSDSPLLEINRYAGDVELVWGDGRTVVVTEVVHVKARNEDEAREEGMRAFSEIEEARDGIRIRDVNGYGEYRDIRIELARGMRAFVSTSNGDISAFSADADVELTSGNGDITVVRAESWVEVLSGNGDITISDVKGQVSALSGAGDITVSGIDHNVDIETGAGDIIISRVSGSVEVQTGGGDILVEDVEESIELRTAGGDVEAYRIGGSAELSTAGGSVEVSDLAGDLFASTMSGDIEGTRIQGDISAETMAGDIEFRDVSGEIVVTSEVGDISIGVDDAAFLRDGQMKLRANYGDVDLDLPRNTNANVSIYLGFEGEFDPTDSPRQLRLRDMTVETRQGRVRSVKGILNDGGGRIEIRTGSGDVSIGSSD